MKKTDATYQPKQLPSTIALSIIGALIIIEFLPLTTIMQKGGLSTSGEIKNKDREVQNVCEFSSDATYQPKQLPSISTPVKIGVLIVILVIGIIVSIIIGFSVLALIMQKGRLSTSGGIKTKDYEVQFKGEINTEKELGNKAETNQGLRSSSGM